MLWKNFRSISLPVSGSVFLAQFTQIDVIAGGRSSQKLPSPPGSNLPRACVTRQMKWMNECMLQAGWLHTLGSLRAAEGRPKGGRPTKMCWHIPQGVAADRPAGPLSPGKGRGRPRTPGSGSIGTARYVPRHS